MCITELTTNTTTADTRIGSQSSEIATMSTSLPTLNQSPLESVLVAHRAAQFLVALAVGLAGEPALVGSTRGLGGAAKLGNAHRPLDQFVQPRQGRAPVAFLGAVVARHDQYLVGAGEALACERAQACLGA